MENQENQVTHDQNAHSDWMVFFVFPAGLLWMELVIRYWDFGLLLSRGLLYTILFTISAGLFLAALCCAFHRRLNRILSMTLMGALTGWYIVQAVYHTIFKTVFGLYLVTEAGDAAEFWKSALLGIRETIPAMIALLVPVFVLFFLGRELTPDRMFGKWRFTALLILAGVFYGGGVLSVRTFSEGILSPWMIYTQRQNPELLVSNFGTLTALRMDVENVLTSSAGSTGQRNWV